MSNLIVKLSPVDLLSYVLQKLVIQTKSVEYMPFTLSLAGFLNGACWTAYGFLPFDINILVSIYMYT